MKDKLILFVKGIVLGISFIIPGVSGGTLAVLMGIYEDLLEAAGNFYKGYKNFKKYFMYLLPIGFGVLFSVAICARIIKFGLDKAPIVTMLIFLGLILGGIPKLFKSVSKRAGFKECLLMLVGVILVGGMLFIDKGSSNVSFSDMGLGGYVLLFLVGMLASGTMVVPGISGSFTLMLIGYYEPILNVINDFTAFTNLGDNILVLVPFMLGIAIGIVVIAKFINFMLRKYYNATYYVIIGFVLSSIISVVYQLFLYDFNSVHLWIGLALMCVNALFVYKIFEK